MFCLLDIKVLNIHSLHTLLIPLFTVSSDFSASQADPKSALTGVIVGVMLSCFCSGGCLGDGSDLFWGVLEPALCQEQAETLRLHQCNVL